MAPGFDHDYRVPMVLAGFARIFGDEKSAKDLERCAQDIKKRWPDSGTKPMSPAVSRFREELQWLVTQAEHADLLDVAASGDHGTQLQSLARDLMRRMEARV